MSSPPNLLLFSFESPFDSPHPLNLFPPPISDPFSESDLVDHPRSDPMDYSSDSALNLHLRLALSENHNTIQQEHQEDSMDDDFFISHRRIGSEFGSDSDSDSINLNAPDDEPNLCLDCLQIDDSSNDFEWEDVVQELDNTASDENNNNIEWQVIMSGSMLQHAVDDSDSYFIDDHDYNDVLFGQFQEHDSAIKGTPPAAKSVVETLPLVIVKKEDACAVCKDEIKVDEFAKKLPCSHYYHEECILPWLGMRNTCPLCRYELPTDDVEYENWKARRSGDRYGFEILPDA